MVEIVKKTKVRAYIFDFVKIIRVVLRYDIYDRFPVQSIYEYDMISLQSSNNG